MCIELKFSHRRRRRRNNKYAIMSGSRLSDKKRYFIETGWETVIASNALSFQYVGEKNLEKVPSVILCVPPVYDY